MESKVKKKKKNEKERSFSERSPLQELKRFPKNGGNCNSNSNTNIPSSSTSVSVEAPKGCLRFLLSANSNSSSSSSSSRKPQFQRKPESFCKFGNKPVLGTPNSAPNLKRVRSKPSKENDLSRVVPSQKPKNKNPSFLSQWQSGKKKPSLRTNFSNPVKNTVSGSEGFRANRKDLVKQKTTCCSASSSSSSSSGQPSEIFSFKVSDNSNSIQDCTPVGKLSCWSALDSSVFDDNKDNNNNKAVVFGGDGDSNSTKTPPVEASVSPEIQSGVSNLFGSAATPVCYGVSHLLSGVTDKRKCKPRGILTIGCSDVDVDEETGNGRISTEILAKSRPSFIPLPTEASMKWLSSPQGEKTCRKCDFDDNNNDDDDQCMTLLGSSSFSLPFSPSNCFPCDLVSDNDEGIDDVVNGIGNTRIVLLSPKRTRDSNGFSGLFTKPMDVHSRKKDGNFSSFRSIGESSPTSTGFCSGFCSSGSGGNVVVQTPTSDSSSSRLVNMVEIDTYDKQKHELEIEIDSVAEFLDRTKFTTNFKHLSSCSSWVSDSTLQNMSLSQMRISWREGLSSRIMDADEFDCCRCLSDEEEEEKPNNPAENDGPNSPEFLYQEPKITGKGKEKEKMSPGAESMSIDAGGLVSSRDSDWTVCYKNHLFEV